MEIGSRREGLVGSRGKKVKGRGSGKVGFGGSYEIRLGVS